MSAETAAMKPISEGVKTGVKETEKLVKKLWSLMDAAARKEAPGEYLSSPAIRSIQGKRPQ
ncbi:hypothetical protein [Promineifilum sp.]|uniref:hypothetical protein n=1 Tax=Promineifilum sp. TaxID=2664178 RepID=UPI0035B10DD0